MGTLAQSAAASFAPEDVLSSADEAKEAAKAKTEMRVHSGLQSLKETTELFQENKQEEAQHSL